MIKISQFENHQINYYNLQNNLLHLTNNTNIENMNQNEISTSPTKNK